MTDTTKPVAMKALEWRDDGTFEAEGYISLRAITILGDYEVFRLGADRKFVAKVPGSLPKTVDTLEAAKAAAQADFDARIRSALSEAPAPEMHLNVEEWFSQVVSFLVKHDMLDAREEYDISDVMTALSDNYEPAPETHVTTAARAFMDLFAVDERGLSIDGIDIVDLTHRYAALEAALSHDVTAWQDISTASRDGSEVLVWNGRRRHVAHFDKIEGEWVSSFKTTTKRLVVAPAPTHWSPLLTEPATTEGSDNG